MKEARDIDRIPQLPAVPETAGARRGSEEANRLKSDFLATVSHELRTPLGAILGFCELILDPEIPYAEKINSAWAVQRNARHLAHLVDDLLDLAKAEADKLDIEPVPFSLRRLLAGVIDELVPAANEKKLNLAILWEGQVDDEVVVDPHRLEQTLLNVLGNAIKFTDKGHVLLRVSQIDGTRGEGEPRACERSHIRFLIEDTGRGMNARQRDRLFEAFVQGEAFLGRRVGGSGVGLVLSRKLARMMGGDLVLVRTAPDEGSVFELTVAAHLDSWFTSGRLPKIGPSRASDVPFESGAVRRAM